MVHHAHSEQTNDSSRFQLSQVMEINFQTDATSRWTTNLVLGNQQFVALLSTEVLHISLQGCCVMFL